MAATADLARRVLTLAVVLALPLTACSAGDEPDDGASPPATDAFPGPRGFTPPPFEEPTQEGTEAEGRPAHAEGPQEPLTWYGRNDEFQAGGGQFEPSILPRAFTCDGPGHTPHVAWRNLPDEAVALALVLVADDTGELHWQASGIAPALGEFQGGEGFPADARVGVNAVTGDGFAPPCSIDGSLRTFTWTIFALAEDVGPFESTDASEVLAGFAGAALAQVTIPSQVGSGTDPED